MDELHYLSDKYGLLLDETIARNLDRSVNGVIETALRRLKGGRRKDNFYTLRVLAETLGLPDKRRIKRWIQREWLKVRKGPTRQGRNLVWTFRERSIVRCLRQRPWLVDPASMPEHYFRSVVRREWERDPWYTSKQTAALLGRKSITSVENYIYRGWLLAEHLQRDTTDRKLYGKRHQGVYIIRLSAIQAFLVNDPRPQSRRKAISESRHNFLLESGQATKLTMVWLLKCPSCGQQVRVDAPPQLYGPQVRERFITLYVNGNCKHGSSCLVSLNGDKGGGGRQCQPS